MKLLLIRHAESVRNATIHGRVFYSHDEEKTNTPTRNINLTSRGELQAQALAELLLCRIRVGTIPFPDFILSSGFVRADTTAEIVIETLANLTCDTESFNQDEKIAVKHNHLLRERDPGYGFELTEGEVKQHFPYLEKYWGLEGKWFSTPPGGENLVSVMDRASLFLNNITNDQRYVGRTGYVFSHGGFMMATKMVVEGTSCSQADEVIKNPSNCHIDTYSNENGYWESV